MDTLHSRLAKINNSPGEEDSNNVWTAGKPPMP